MDGTEEDGGDARGRTLLAQLDLIFLSDPLIDELGFVHPAQMISLQSSDNNAASASPFVRRESRNSSDSTGASAGEDEPHAHADCSRKSEHGVEVIDAMKVASFDGERARDDVAYDRTAFWCENHKLAISMLVLGPLYKCAKLAFSVTCTNYRKLAREEQSRGLGEQSKLPAASENGDAQEVNGTKISTASEVGGLKDSLLSYTRALVLINCDHASAWNMRKQIITLKASNQGVFSEELRLASVVLSVAPKSEETWAHRRWVINQMISAGISRVELDSILEGDSKLVEVVAERSPMNYRAWRHRCWLVSQMSFLQIAIELHRTKQWAASHVADNCCFHYRRSLLLQLLKSKVPGMVQSRPPAVTAVEKELDMKSFRVALFDGPQTQSLWKEEVCWIKTLIQRFMGREALWIHLRFLFYVWVLHLGPILCSPFWKSNSAEFFEAGQNWDLEETFLSMSSEQRFVGYCISGCNKSVTDDANRQREFAATYKLWVHVMVSRKPKEETAGKNGRRSVHQDERSSLEKLLHDVVPHRRQMWENLLLSE